MFELLQHIQHTLLLLSSETDSASVHINDDGRVTVKVGVMQTRTMTLEEFAEWLN